MEVLALLSELPLLLLLSLLLQSSAQVALLSPLPLGVPDDADRACADEHERPRHPRHDDEHGRQQLGAEVLLLAALDAVALRRVHAAWHQASSAHVVKRDQRKLFEPIKAASTPEVLHRPPPPAWPTPRRRHWNNPIKTLY